METVSKIDQEFGAALSAGDVDKAAVLLKSGANIDRLIPITTADDRGIYPDTTTYLIDSALRGQVDLVRFLLKTGADPNIAGLLHGQTALLAATQGGYVEIVDLLLAHGAAFSAVDHPSKLTAMEYAITNENAAIVRSLLAAGAPAVCRRLTLSVDGGAAAREIVRMLIEHGFDINKTDDWGRTPLMWAVQRAPLETVQFLIEAGADVNIVSGKNMNGVSSHETALQLATRAQRNDVVALLLRHGAEGKSSVLARIRKRMGL
jgi:ankyrin repeat protein